MKAAVTDDTLPVIAQMKKVPVNNFMTKNGTMDDAGQVFSADQETIRIEGAWDLVKVVATIPADRAFRPLPEKECLLAKNTCKLRSESESAQYL